MPDLTTIVPLLKIMLVFAAMLTGIRFKIGLGASILAGSLLLALLFGLPFDQWPELAGLALTNPKALYLGGIVGLILVLSGLMDSTGQAARLMENVRGYFKNPRLGLVFFPALIGLLPMPGGAIFSAPMVAAYSDKLGIGNQDKALINYWFRHIWEMCWPLYPGMILAASLSGIPIHKVVAYCSPGTLICLGLGWLFFLRPQALAISPDDDKDAETDEHRGSMGAVVYEGLPLIIAITGAIGMELVISVAWPQADFELGVLAALGAGAACTALQNKISPAALVKTALNKHLASMLFIIASIFVFKEMLTGAGVVRELAAMAGGELALFAAAAFLPFLVGLVSGITVAFVGAALPLLLALLEPLGLAHMTLPYLILFMFAGFTGVMASPLHLCFILTCRYFDTDLAKAWRRLFLPSGLMMIAGAAYFYLMIRP